MLENIHSYNPILSVNVNIVCIEIEFGCCDDNGGDTLFGGFIWYVWWCWTVNNNQFRRSATTNLPHYNLSEIYKMYIRTTLLDFNMHLINEWSQIAVESTKHTHTHKRRRRAPRQNLNINFMIGFNLEQFFSIFIWLVGWLTEMLRWTQPPLMENTLHQTTFSVLCERYASIYVCVCVCFSHRL